MMAYWKWSLLLRFVVVGCAACCTGGYSAENRSTEFVEISAGSLEDKIQGGLLGQLLGNLNGLPHENKYYDEPGNVTEYAPGLPNGARTDDDTDIEWVYIKAMQEGRTAMLDPRDTNTCSIASTVS